MYEVKTSSLQTSNLILYFWSENKQKVGTQDEVEPSQNKIRLQSKSSISVSTNTGN